MSIIELKQKCNQHYSQAIELIENNGDVQLICKNLLESASLLMEIGKISASEKQKCEDKAVKLLEATKKIRLGEAIDSVYLFLTGRKLEKTVETVSIKPKNEEVNKPIDNDAIKEILKDKPKVKQIATPEHFKFNWDSLPEITFDDVAGLEDVKDAVRSKVLLPLTHPELFEGYDKKNGGGLLLYGPPGTGKTMIAAAIAKEIGAKFCSVGVSDIVQGGLGNSEKAIDKLFEEARSFPCSVIFFDEMESICPATTHAQHAKQIRSELLRQIQGLDAYGKENDKILFLIAATNKPWDIDPAFVRPGRFGTRVYVGLPDNEARKYMILSRINKIKSTGKVIVEDIDINKIVEKSQGFNGADVSNLMDVVQEISIMRAVRTGEKALLEADFNDAFKKVTSSAQTKDLEKLNEWKNLNG